MTRTTHCNNPDCRKELDEFTRQHSIQEFGFAVCSLKCWDAVTKQEEFEGENHLPINQPGFFKESEEQ